MVLQAGQSVAFWGWANPGTDISVAFESQGVILVEAKATADQNGRWTLHLPPLTAGSSGVVQISNGSDKRVINDVLVGQAWLAGAQSNMEYSMGAKNIPPDMFATAQKMAISARSSIRYFHISARSTDEEQDDVEGSWIVAAPENIAKCSAVAWYFGVALHEKLHQPVGLVISSVGATPVEAWMPKKELLATSAGIATMRRHLERLAASTPQMDLKYKAAMAAWQKKYPTEALQSLHVGTRPSAPYTATARQVPIRFYNGMIHGLEPYTIAGFIWYQADGNSGHPEEYPELIKTLIQTWRNHWQAELPFYYVEMNNMWEAQQQPVDTQRNLALIREAQAAALELPKTGVVAAIDLAGPEAQHNPHFSNKKPVGDRLAGLALTDVYGQQFGEVHSPEFRKFSIEGDKVRLSFKYAGGLRTRGGREVKGFAIRGSTGEWLWAEGKIEGQEIIVSNPKVQQPQAVRYAWAANPVISIENGVGLPLRPFRTDKQSPQ